MKVLFFLLLSSVIAGAVLYIVLAAGIAFARTRGKRLVTCPENGRTAAVTLDSWRGALAAPFSRRLPELQECSRWPEMRRCGQECVSQVAEAPDGCLVRSLVERWYSARSCALCGRPFGAMSLAEHRPALLAPDGATTQWHEVRPESLPELFATHRPVCWNCHVVQTLVQKRPDLVVVRPPHPDPQQVM